MSSSTETAFEDILVPMAKALSHRGPDDRGLFIDASSAIGLAHNRLSIIDLSSAGHQPMVTRDRRFVITYNGELYNFRELRAELEFRGRIFASRSDTEVVLTALAEWGLAALDRFRGMFAFALWDSHERVLTLARDPLGMKPLYYGTLPNGRGFMFASELKAFLAIPGYVAKANRASVHQFLEFGYVFDREATALAGVRKLAPGHLLQVRNGVAATSRRYFALPEPEESDARSLPQRETELFETLDQVIAQHLIADVPVGLLLSGGLDSSLIAALASRRTRVTTISMGFAQSAVDERPCAARVASFVRSDHREVLIRPEDVRDELESAVWYFDDLFDDWGTVSTRILYRRCREMGIKVVLVGEGSDELWGGYGSFVRAHNARGPRTWTLLDLYRRYAGRRYGREFVHFRAIMREYLNACDDDLFEAVRRFETLNQLPNNYVMKVDKASMSVSVEARAPFLDRRVAEFACRTPAKLLVGADTTKSFLRGMARRFQLLPRETLDRPKFGGSMAMSWMDDSTAFRAFARRVVLEQSGWTDELGLRDAMVQYFDRGRNGYGPPRGISIFRSLAWRLLLLNMWSRRYATA